MRYLIIDTWNGEGYSESGIIRDITYTDMDENTAKYNALEVAREEFGERYLPSADDQEVKVTYQQNALCVNDGDDDGAIHWRKVEPKHHALWITPDINDVSLLRKESFLECITSLRNDGGLQSNLESDNITWEEWLDDLYTEGHNDGHGDNGYFIIYKL